MHQSNCWHILNKNAEKILKYVRRKICTKTQRAVNSAHDKNLAHAKNLVYGKNLAPLKSLTPGEMFSVHGNVGAAGKVGGAAVQRLTI